jgi:hypothetical protein
VPDDGVVVLELGEVGDELYMEVFRSLLSELVASVICQWRWECGARTRRGEKSYEEIGCVPASNGVDSEDEQRHSEQESEEHSYELPNKRAWVSIRCERRYLASLTFNLQKRLNLVTASAPAPPAFTVLRNTGNLASTGKNATVVPNAVAVPSANRTASPARTSLRTMMAAVGKARTAMKAPYLKRVYSQDENQDRGRGPVWMRKSQKQSSSRWVILVGGVSVQQVTRDEGGYERRRTTRRSKQ